MRGACACALVCAVVAVCAAGGLDEATRAAAEKQLLALLGLPRRPPRRPQPTPAPVQVPRALRMLYEAHATLPAAANTARSFHHTPTELDARFPADHRFRLYFNVSAVPADETVRGANLAFQRDPVRSGCGVQRLLVYDVVRPGRRGRSAPVLRLVDSVLVRADAEDSVHADVAPAARRWLAEPRHNHGLLVRVLEAGRDERTSGGEDARRPHVRVRRGVEEESRWHALQPQLVLFTEDERAREARRTRDRRATPRRGHRSHQRRKESREICQRRPLFVDFAEVGWNDWIVAPQGYDAYYCQGDCPFPLSDHLNGTNHAIVQTLVNSVKPAAVPKACCVPTQLSSISMLYMDEVNNVVLKNYQDMMVVGCGCR